MVQPGEGLVGFEAVLRTLICTGYDGPLCIEKVPGIEDEDMVTVNLAAARIYVQEFVQLVAREAGTVKRNDAAQAAL